MKQSTTQPPRATEVAARLRVSMPAYPWQLGPSGSVLSAIGLAPLRPTRREFLIGAGSLLVLAPYGCGGGTGGEGASGGTRTVRHELGGTEVPVDPGRIVTIDSGETMAHLLALGEEAPLAAGSYFPQSDDPWPALSAEQTEGVEAFDRLQPPLERIAALEPDLIIGSASYMESVYDRLQEIAPAVAVNEFGDDGGWKTALIQVGEALGKRENAERVIAEFDERVAEAREELQDAVETVSVVSVFPDTVRIWRPEVSEAEILEELGLNIVPEAEEFEGSAADLSRSDRIDISRELLPRIDGQALILRQTLQDEEVQRALEDLRNSSLWQELPAVQNGLVLVVNSLAFTGGVFGYRDLLDRYVEFLDGTAKVVDG